jgi:hypothetical protein
VPGADADWQGLIQSGGVAALAALVYLELRALRPVLRSLDRAVTALLERERARSADTGPHEMPSLPRTNTRDLP